MKIEAWFDGACEPRNPGGAMGIGAWMLINSQKYIHSKFVPASINNTNNVAEYMAFERVLDFLIEKELTLDEVIIRGDSKLVMSQMAGTWQIRSGAYVSFAISCKQKLTKFSNLSLEWIPRAENEFADNLSKRELKRNNIKITIR